MPTVIDTSTYFPMTRGTKMHYTMTVDNEPAVSAILVAAEDFSSLKHVLFYLAGQTISGQIEIVLVGPRAADASLAELKLEGFFGYQTVAMPQPGFSAAEGYGAGIRQARAPVVVLCEDHSFPEPDWAEHLLRAHEQPWAAVGPAVRNGNPETLLSWVDFFMGYSEWAYPVPSGIRQHLPGHNSSYKRDLLLEYDTALIDRLEAESVLHWDLGRRGYQLYLESQAVTRHLNFALFSTWFPLHFWSGRRFASTRGRGWPLWRCLLYVCASPLIPLVRFRRIFAEARKPGRYPGSLLRLAPVLLLGLLLDGFGQMLGYAFGPGDTMEKSAELELHIEKRVGVSPS